MKLLCSTCICVNYLARLKSACRNLANACQPVNFGAKVLSERWLANATLQVVCRC
jgi:hypothetical protein